MNQISFDEMLYSKYQITKPIRLIELFAGVGSQSMALRNLGVEFEHYKMVEFDKYPVASYNAIHNTNFEPSDITKVSGKELNIVDTNIYEYIMTYSFPCQDLSIAGLQRGMKKGTSTRSGLLWEVERLLNESEELPQVLLMENVPQVIADANIEDFKKWQQFLESKGYKNFTKVLNAKSYGIPQNRERCFMVSILDQNAYYKFPEPIKLHYTVKDLLEDVVDERFYINGEKVEKLLSSLFMKDENYNRFFSQALETLRNNECEEGDIIDAYNKKVNKTGNSPTITTRPEGFKTAILVVDVTINEPKEKDISNCIKARYDCGISNQRSDGTMVVEPKVNCLNTKDEKGKQPHQHDRIYDTNGLMTSLMAEQNGRFNILEPKVKQVGNLVDTGNWDNAQRGRVYSADGISPSLNTVGGGGLEPKMIVASRGRNPNNPSDRTAGTQLEQRLEPNLDGCSNTLTTVQKDILVLIKQATDKGYIECENGGVADLSYPTSKTRRGRVQENGTVSPTITATETGVCKIEDYRVRKLTPKECWRLMGFTDADFSKAEEVNSNSQLYKQAGNSIVVNVLEPIFKEMM